jgi:hypothetical protein
MAEPSVITTAGFPSEEPIDRSAAGLQFQRYQLGLKATGAALGVGRRSVPDPNSQFRNPPMSSAQFGGGSNARQSVGEGAEAQEEL